MTRRPKADLFVCKNCTRLRYYKAYDKVPFLNLDGYYRLRESSEMWFCDMQFLAQSEDGKFLEERGDVPIDCNFMLEQIVANDAKG